LFEGAVQLKDAVVFPYVDGRLAVGALGVAGIPAGVTLFEAPEVDEPKGFVAVTVNVYAVPLDRPVTTNGEPEPLAVNPPGLEVAVYVGIPVPIITGGVKATLACWSPLVAVPIVGASGFIPAPKPNLRVDPLPIRFTNGTVYLMQIATGLQAW
jgi:hypothetical protein